MNNSLAKLKACKADEQTYWVPTSQMPKADPKEMQEMMAGLGDWVDAISEVDQCLVKEAGAENEVSAAINVPSC